MCSSEILKREIKSKNELKIKRKLDKRITKLEKKYKDLIDKANNYSNNHSHRQIFLKYKKKSIKVKDDIYKLIIPFLEANDPEFKKIALENYGILEVDEFKMKTVEQCGGIFGNYAAEMIGKVNRNGLLYLTTTKSDLSFLNPFSKYQYPSRLRGRIDCLGYVRIITTEVGTAFFKTIPKFYVGKIGKNGEIDLLITGRESDYITGKIMMSKLVGNLLLRNEVDDKRFWSNCDLLIDIIERFRNNYC